MLAEGGFSGLISFDEVDESQLALDQFDCGREELNQFLVEQSKALHADRLGLTHFLFHEEVGLVGFVTLSSDSIPLKTSEVGEMGLAYAVEFPTFPAMKIGRLAVDSRYHHQGIGKRMIELVLGYVFDGSQKAAIRFLITDAVNLPEVVEFYGNLGFVESLWASTKAGSKARPTIKMIRDIYHQP